MTAHQPPAPAELPAAGAGLPPAPNCHAPAEPEPVQGVLPLEVT